jgi:hypothetical protein
MNKDGRVVIPGGRAAWPAWKHLVPIARFLVEERGHLPLYAPDRWGWSESGSFQFSRRITQADWTALNEHYVIPPNIVFWEPKAWIQDNDNRIWFEGNDVIVGSNGPEPIGTFEAQERALDRTYGRPDLGQGKAAPFVVD